MSTFFKNDFINVKNKNIYFFDLGANIGEVSDKMNSLFKLNSNNAKFFLVEPNPDNFNLLKAKFKSEKNFSFFNVAGWDQKDKMEFWIGKKNTATNSRLKKIIEDHKKDKSKYSKKIVVDTIDTSKFIVENVKQKDKNDIVILKMDIEGSEYTVIDSLIKNETIKNIDYLLIEYHNTKNDSENSKLYNEKLKKANRGTLIYQEYQAGYRGYKKVIL